MLASSNDHDLTWTEERLMLQLEMEEVMVGDDGGEWGQAKFCKGGSKIIEIVKKRRDKGSHLQFYLFLLMP